MNARAVRLTRFLSLPSERNVRAIFPPCQKADGRAESPKASRAPSIRPDYLPRIVASQASSCVFTSSPFQMFWLAEPIASQKSPISEMDGMGKA